MVHQHAAMKYEMNDAGCLLFRERYYKSRDSDITTTSQEILQVKRFRYYNYKPRDITSQEIQILQLQAKRYYKSRDITREINS